MKRILSLVLLGLACGASDVSAQEAAENELKMVQQLRLRGWNDLLKQKLEALAQSTDPVLLAALPLETARASVALARLQSTDQRLVSFGEARAELLKFINKNAGTAPAALARSELARLTTFHAQTLLTRAMYEDDNKSRHEKARPAEAKFQEAAQDLASAKKAIEEALLNPANASWKNTLQQELLQVRYDMATNLFNQARTYLDTFQSAENEKRSKTIDSARIAFLELSKDPSTQVGLQANAWLIKCNIELTDPGEAEKAFAAVMKKAADKSAQPAVRLARYFYMQDISFPREEQWKDADAIGGNLLKKVGPKLKQLDRLHMVQKEGESWLADYRSSLDTYEGQGVLYELAWSYFLDARSAKDQKVAGPLFDKAANYFETLAEMDCDLSERAGRLGMRIKFNRAGTKVELNTFEDCLMKAMYDREKVRELNTKLEDPKADKAKLEQERKQHLRDVVKSINRGLALATSRTPVKKVDEARYMLSGAYLAGGDPYRAAIVAEALGRNRPPTAKSPEGAATAIQTYSAMQERKADDVVRKRLEDLAGYVLAKEQQITWKKDPVSSMAHYHLAMAAKRDGNNRAAIDHLDQLDPSFVGYIYTQGQLVYLALAALERLPAEADTIIENDKKKGYTDKDKQELIERLKKGYIEKIKTVIARMPAIKAKEDPPSVITMYFFAKLELSKLLYSEAIQELNAKQELKAVKKCTEMADYVNGLLNQFKTIPPGKLTVETHEQLEFTMHVMLKYADLGIAETRFRSTSADRFDHVLKATQAVTEKMLEKAKALKPGEPLKLKDYRVTGDILGLALRANVQQGNVVKGKAILDILKRLTGPEGAGSGGNIVGVVLRDIAEQIKAMKKDKDATLNKTKANYAAFLDEIAKEYEARGYDNATAMLIGHAFVSLDLPAKAVLAYGKVKEPASLGKKMKEKSPKDTPEEEKARQQWDDELRQYWGMQVEYIRALRACNDKDSAKTAEKLAVALVAHPNSRFQAQAMIERNLVLEEMGDREVAEAKTAAKPGWSPQYRAAYLEWQKFLGMPSLRDKSSKDVQKLYFPGYFYWTRTTFRMAVNDEKIKDREKFISFAARKIVDLEFAATKEGWNIVAPQYEELLRSEPRLKAEYDKEKAKRLAK